jgi:hypothetical protein
MASHQTLSPSLGSVTGEPSFNCSRLLSAAIINFRHVPIFRLNELIFHSIGDRSVSLLPLG